MKKINLRKYAVAAIVGGMFAALFMIPSCKKKSTTTAMTLYDSLGGVTMVSDPSNPGMMIEKGRLGIRSVVEVPYL